MVAAGDASKGFDLQKLNKFSKSEILDPLVQEEKNLAAQLREGLSKLLDMHNPAELGSLCGAMGLVEECEFGTHAEKKAGVLRKVAQTGARYNSTERAHMECLETMWDGILYEYLRAEGQPLRSARVDPRVFTLQMWRRRAAFSQGGQGIFRPHYVPRMVRMRDQKPPRAADLEGLLRGVEAKELALKHIERKVRKESDYRNVIRFLADTTSLHEFERDARDYLMHELESCRDRIDHYQASLEMTGEQLGEAELVHERATTTLVSQLARVEAELEFQYDLSAIEPATEEQMIVGVLRRFLATPGPMDGTLTLEDSPVALPSLDDDWSDSDDERSEYRPPSTRPVTQGRPTSAGSRGKAPTPLEGTRPSFDDFQEETQSEIDEREFRIEEHRRKDDVRRNCAIRCPNYEQREPAVLACLAFEKHRGDVNVMRLRCEASEAAFDALYEWFDEANADRAAKTAEAVHAGRRSRILGQQINMLIEEAAKAAATPFAEVELYKGIAARATCDASDAKSRLRNATPTLLAMIGADDGSIAVLGAVLSVALGAVPSRAAALERLEAATMAREELHQRTVDALSIPTPTMSDKKKAGKKGKDKKGKGGKKGGKGKKGGGKGGKEKGAKKGKGGKGDKGAKGKGKAKAKGGDGKKKAKKGKGKKKK